MLGFNWCYKKTSEKNLPALGKSCSYYDSTNMGINLKSNMRKWLVWAGIALVIGGGISLAMTLAVEGDFDLRNEFSSYSIAWLIGGAIIVILGLILKPKKPV